ncbi:MAG: DUF4105 domain-containing protein [Longimicrobiales bacterium]|nr:DUF4105 domain-containing protein [Longimicrobiales bacterium]
MSRSDHLVALSFVALIVCGAGPVTAAAVQPPSEAAFDRFTVHLVTMSPGEEVWERFSHNGVWIKDHATGEDFFFEWGLFDFGQVDFVPRLVRGEMLYRMGATSFEGMLVRYGGRRVWADELALTPAQEAALVALLVENARPENRDYIYHYYLRNCSTRLRDALDAPGVLDGALHRALGGVETGRSWRWHTLRLLRELPWAYYGIHLALGQPTDREIDRWEETFLPLRLRAAVREMVVSDGAGGERPLVRADTLLVAGEARVPLEKPNRVFSGLVVGLLLGGGFLLVGRWARTALAGRVVLGVLGSATALLYGVAGILMPALWFFTDHDFAARNEGILQATPFHLLLVLFLLPLVAGRRPGARAVRLSRWLSALALLGLLLKALPPFTQANLELIVLLLPLQLGLAGAIARAALAPAAVAEDEIAESDAPR